MPTVFGMAFNPDCIVPSFAKILGPPSFSSFTLARFSHFANGSLDLRLLRHRNNKTLIRTMHAKPPTTPPTIAATFVAPLLAIVSPGASTSWSGPMIPADPPGGVSVAAEGVGLSLGTRDSRGCSGCSGCSGCPGVGLTDDSLEIGTEGRDEVGEMDDIDKTEVIAASIEPVSVAGVVVGVRETATLGGAAASVPLASVSLTTTAGSGAAAAGGVGTKFASGADCAADDAAGLSASVAEGAASWDEGAAAAWVDDGGSSAASFVSICCASVVVAEGATSGGVTWAASELRVGVAAVRARERVHRLPLTVVIDSCGVDMPGIDS